MNEEELRELDVAIARAMGCSPGETRFDWICACGLGIEGVDQRWPVGDHWKETESYVPYFSENLDALSNGPEKALREAGHCFTVEYDEKHARWYAQWGFFEIDAQDASAPTEPLARAQAALRALQAIAVASVPGEQ